MTSLLNVWCVCWVSTGIVILEDVHNISFNPTTAKHGKAPTVIYCGEELCIRLTQIARFTRLTWGPPGSYRAQVSPTVAIWTLLSASSLKWFNNWVFWRTKQQNKTKQKCIALLTLGKVVVNIERSLGRHGMNHRQFDYLFRNLFTLTIARSPKPCIPVPLWGDPTGLTLTSCLILKQRQGFSCYQ